MYLYIKRKEVDSKDITYSKQIQKADLKQLLKNIYPSVYIGNLFRVERKCRQINQKLSNWSYNEHIRRLQSKLDLFVYILNYLMTVIQDITYLQPIKLNI